MSHFDIQTELTDREIDKLYTALERRGIFAKRRELRASPSEIAIFIGWSAPEVAKLAGRKENKPVEIEA